MSRASVLLKALADGLRPPLICTRAWATPPWPKWDSCPTKRFRAELVGLLAAGLTESETAPDGSTIWRLAKPGW